MAWSHLWSKWTHQISLSIYPDTSPSSVWTWPLCFLLTIHLHVIHSFTKHLCPVSGGAEPPKAQSRIRKKVYVFSRSPSWKQLKLLDSLGVGMSVADSVWVRGFLFALQGRPEVIVALLLCVFKLPLGGLWRTPIYPQGQIKYSDVTTAATQSCVQGWH